MSNMVIDDENRAELFKKFLAGEPAASAELTERLMAKLRPLASRLLRVEFTRLTDETDDILQESLYRILSYIKRIEFRSNEECFESLAARIIRQTLLDAVRKHFGTLQARPMEEGLMATHPLLRQSSGMDDVRERLRIHEFIERLPDAERRVIEMKMYMGLNGEEIAEALEIEPWKVSRLLRSALERLGRMLKEDDQKAG